MIRVSREKGTYVTYGNMRAVNCGAVGSRSGATVCGGRYSELTKARGGTHGRAGARPHRIGLRSVFINPQSTIRNPQLGLSLTVVLGVNRHA